MLNNNNNNSKQYLPNIGTPRIYVYTTPVNKKDGWLKIGFTERVGTKEEAAEKRISEQVTNIVMPNADIHYEILWIEDAVCDNKECFTDKDIHKILETVLKKNRFYDANNTASEWFQCSLDDIKSAINYIKHNIPIGTNVNKDSFKPRKEQIDAIEVTKNYFLKNKKNNESSAPHFLWNAKMRFGKTYTTYQLVKEMGWKNILVLTYKPAVQNSWEEDIHNHIDFDGWIFKNPKEISSEKLTINDFNKDVPVICFASFQDIQTKDKEIKEKHLTFYDIEWDCIVLDEYHFGSWRDNARELYDPTDSIDEIEAIESQTSQKVEKSFKSKHYLYLSGTPFRSLSSGEFTDEQVFSWTYADEQNAKENWNTTNPNEVNPYAELPQMVMLTYKMENEWKEHIEKDTGSVDFSLNLFFKAIKKGKTYSFVYKEQIIQWLKTITGKNKSFEIKAYKNNTNSNILSAISEKESPLPFKEGDLKSYLNHTLWFLPDVASCSAMYDLLHELTDENNVFEGYEIINASGSNVGSGVNALKPVNIALNRDGKTPMKTKTITLTCGKLTTGVTVPPWTGILILRSLSSPESYFQSIFRVQSPWVIKNRITGERQILKDRCYVFDFAPNRALRVVSDYCSRAIIKSNTDNPTQNPEDVVVSFVNFLPIFFSDGYSMSKLDAKGLLDYVLTGTSSSMLAKKFQSDSVINLDGNTLTKLKSNQNLIDELSKIEAFRKLKNQLDIIISADNLVNDAKMNNKKLTSDEKNKIDEAKTHRETIQKLLKKLITRLPIFMYLTDDRESSIQELIISIEPDLFVKSTGISIKSFEELCNLNVFNKDELTMAIFAFKKYEEASLSYLDGVIKQSEYIAGFDNVFTQEEARKLIEERTEL